MNRRPASFVPFFGSITWRLTLWYGLILALILATVGAATYWAVSLSLTRQGAERVLAKSEAIRRQLSSSSDQEEHQHLDLTDADLLAAVDGFYVQLVALDGRSLNRSPVFPPGLTASPPAASRVGPALLQTEAGTFLYDSQPILQNGRPVAFLQVALPWQPSQEALDTLRRFLLLAATVGLVLALAGGFLVARLSLRPVAAITGTAMAISRKDLSQRLTLDGPRDELYWLAQAFNQMLDRIEGAFEDQKRFVADASHELRTPLAVIRGYTGILQRWGQEDPAVRDEAVAAIRREADFLAKMVERLLLLASGDAGRRVERERVDLKALLGEVAEEVRVLAGAVRLEVGPLDEVSLCADPFLLRQLVTTLLDNAFKYTPPGGSVSLSLTAGDHQAKLAVRDTGEGMPPEDLPHIFERFYRVDKARSRQKGGSGLGLAIARWIAEAHGGEIEVVSSPGQGSAFTVRLPMGEPPYGET